MLTLKVVSERDTERERDPDMYITTYMCFVILSSSNK